MKWGGIMKLSILGSEQKNKFKATIQYCFNISEESIDLRWDYCLKDNNCLAVMRDEKVAATVSINPFKLRYGQKQVNMGGIGLVATLPEYRHNNYASDTLIAALKKMREDNQIFSMLGPFSVEYYRKYGWKIAYMMYQFRFPVINLKGMGEGSGYFRPLSSKDIDDINRVYNDFYDSYNGSVIRDYNLWDYLLQRYALNTGIYIYGYFDTQHKMQGYLIYELKDKTFDIKELCYNGLAVKNELLLYIYKHRAQVDDVTGYLPPDDKTILHLKHIKGCMLKQVTGKMARVVDVRKALELFSYNIKEKVSFTIAVRDRYAEWNNGLFSVDVEKDYVKVKLLTNQIEDSIREADISVSIGALSQILLGFLSLDESVELGFANLKADRFDLITLFGSRVTFITDRF